jgi:hypothetical protein
MFKLNKMFRLHPSKGWGLVKKKRIKAAKKRIVFFYEAHADWQKFGEAGNSNFWGFFKTPNRFLFFRFRLPGTDAGA